MIYHLRAFALKHENFRYLTTAQKSQYVKLKLDKAEEF